MFVFLGLSNVYMYVYSVILQRLANTTIDPYIDKITHMSNILVMFACMQLLYYLRVGYQHLWTMSNIGINI